MTAWGGSFIFIPNPY